MSEHLFPPRQIRLGLPCEEETKVIDNLLFGSFSPKKIFSDDVVGIEDPFEKSTEIT